MKERVYFPTNFDSSSDRHRLTSEEVSRYQYLVKEAKTATAYPDQSGFFVRTSGIAKDGTLWKGGNKEYGLSDAFIHGETAVVSGLRDLTDSPIEAIAWYSEREIGPESFGRPCGNCRDILTRYCGPDTVLLNGNENSFVYTKLKDYWFDDYKGMETRFVDQPGLNEALKALDGGTSIYLPDRLKNQIYGAAIVSLDGTIWRGGHYSNTGYDSVTPLLSAVINWRNSYPVGEVSDSHFSLSKLVVVSNLFIPDVFYRDRQAILELNEIVRRFTGRGEPLGIQLVHARNFGADDTVIFSAAMTDCNEWIPHPFSASAFGMDDVLDGQIRGLTGLGK